MIEKLHIPKARQRALLAIMREESRDSILAPESNLRTASLSADKDILAASVREQLTPKEMVIIALVVQGSTNREIALRLRLSEQIIKNYLRSIYDKTGVNDRLELALFIIHNKNLAQLVAELVSELEGGALQRATAAS